MNDTIRSVRAVERRIRIVGEALLMTRCIASPAPLGGKNSRRPSGHLRRYWSGWILSGDTSLLDATEVIHDWTIGQIDDDSRH